MGQPKTRSVTGVDQEIGELLRARREDLGAAIRDVATEVGLSYQQYQKYEVGENRVSVAMLLRIARVLRIDATELIPGVRMEPRRPNKSEDAQAEQLLEAFRRISSANERRLVLDLAKGLGDLQVAKAEPLPPKRKSRR